MNYVCCNIRPKKPQDYDHSFTFNTHFEVTREELEERGYVIYGDERDYEAAALYGAEFT